jgi:cob(I)alamin adenosyltransferase
VVTLRAGEQISASVQVYLNRLSDLLFVLARAANAAAKVPDITW